VVSAYRERAGRVGTSKIDQDENPWPRIQDAAVRIAQCTNEPNLDELLTALATAAGVLIKTGYPADRSEEVFEMFCRIVLSSMILSQPAPRKSRG
jgi:hypothetical protein